MRRDGCGGSVQAESHELFAAGESEPPGAAQNELLLVETAQVLPFIHSADRKAQDPDPTFGRPTRRWSFGHDDEAPIPIEGRL
jgi:hypothetical protein